MQIIILQYQSGKKEEAKEVKEELEKTNADIKVVIMEDTIQVQTICANA